MKFNLLWFLPMDFFNPLRLCVCVSLSTSPWGFPELWGEDVPTSDIDQYRPYLRHLFLHSLLIETAPPSLPSVQCPSGEASHSWHATPSINVSLHDIIRPPGCHPSTSQHTKKPSPASPSPVIYRSWIILPALAPFTPSKLSSPSLPCWHQNIF